MQKQEPPQEAQQKPTPALALPGVLIIHRWRLHTERDVSIEIAAGAKVLEIGTRGSQVFLWALVRRDAPMIRRRFRIVSDDVPIVPLKGEALNYIGTALAKSFTWHVFEVVPQLIPSGGRGAKVSPSEGLPRGRA